MPNPEWHLIGTRYSRGGRVQSLRSPSQEVVMRRICSAFILTAALAAPLGAAPAAEARAFAPGSESTVVIRVYDPYRHDYHRWNHAEEARYREYLRERRRSYVVYRQQRETQRRAYWRWRHERER